MGKVVYKCTSCGEGWTVPIRVGHATVEVSCKDPEQGFRNCPRYKAMMRLRYNAMLLKERGH